MKYRYLHHQLWKNDLNIINSIQVMGFMALIHWANYKLLIKQGHALYTKVFYNKWISSTISTENYQAKYQIFVKKTSKSKSLFGFRKLKKDLDNFLNLVPGFDFLYISFWKGSVCSLAGRVFRLGCPKNHFFLKLIRYI